MTLPMLADAIIKIRQEELQREAERERLVRIARSHARDDQHHWRIVAVVKRVAPVIRAAAGFLRPRPSLATTDAHVVDGRSGGARHRARGRPLAVPGSRDERDGS
jgi:hypothetical protein